jgi:hypothetical protein
LLRTKGSGAVVLRRFFVSVDAHKLSSLATLPWSYPHRSRTPFAPLLFLSVFHLPFHVLEAESLG